MKNESVIDFPKSDLCPEIWEKVISARDGLTEVYQLIPEVEAKIIQIYNQLQKDTNMSFSGARITGSITSNTYTENADIDLHILIKNLDHIKDDTEKVDTYNKLIRDKYKKTYIGKHPIEVYYQPNEFQDLMSVGCYDIINKIWLAGPDIKPKDYNPYDEYYYDIQRFSNILANQIRNIILSVYEISIVYLKNLNQSIGPSIRSHLLSKLADSKKLYDEIRNSRKVFSSPSSEEEAIKYKNSRKWKIADASFKLFDKYGYLAILKEFIKVYDLMNSSSDIDIEGVNDILETVKKYLYNADKLAETEIYEDDKIGGINGISRSDVESDLKYFVEEVLEDNYFDNIEVIEVWLHGSRMRGDFKNNSDLDAVVFYKGHEKEDTIYNVLADESYDVMGIEVDFNPIRVDDDNDIKDYKDDSNEYDRKKLGENKQIDEGFKEAASSFALSLALLIPGIASAQTIRYAIENNTSIKKVYNKENIFKKLLKDQKPDSQFGKFKFWQACNITALTLFGEGRSEISNGGIDLICDSILNRTAIGTPDLQRVADICVGRKEGKKFQYSFWNENKKALNVITNELNAIVPTSITNIIEKQAWEFCIQRSVEILTKNYTVTDTKINSYYVTKMKNPPDWADELTNKQIKGKHTFGYLTSNDPKYTDMATMIPHDENIDVSKLPYFIYTIKHGDNLWNLAKRFSTKVKILAKLNKISTNKILKPGQKIKINDISKKIDNKEVQQEKIPEIIYIAKNTDTLGKIAKNNNMSIKEILDINPQIKNPDRIYPGQKINILKNKYGKG